MNATRRIAWVTLAAAVGVGGTLALGRWQLSRAAYKQGLQADLQAQVALAPLTNAQLAALAELGPVVHRRVELQGRWLPQHQVFLDNRPLNGQAGWLVLTPLELSGTGSGRAPVVLVQRGWAPRDFLERTRLPPVLTPPGDYALHGRLAPGPSKVYELGSPGAGRIRQNLDLQAFAAETGLPLLPFSVVQTDAASEGLLRDWPSPASGVDKHHGYAFQWFGLSALVALLYVGFLYRERFKPRAQPR